MGVTAAGGVLQLDVSKKMIHAARNASALRNEALKKHKESEHEIEAKRFSVAEEITKLNLKKRSLLLIAKEEAAELQKKVKKLKTILN